LIIKKKILPHFSEIYMKIKILKYAILTLFVSCNAYSDDRLQLPDTENYCDVREIKYLQSTGGDQSYIKLSCTKKYDKRWPHQIDVCVHQILGKASADAPEMSLGTLIGFSCDTSFLSCLNTDPCPCNKEQAAQDADAQCRDELGWIWVNEEECEWECGRCDEHAAIEKAELSCGPYWEWIDQEICVWGCEQCGQEKAMADTLCGPSYWTMDMDTCEWECDQCPNDPNKTEPGICGCGVPDTDSDGDGTLDCVDNCPDDSNKTEPGICGCGVPDTDSDGDGTPDCNDKCPDDPNKTEPGICGCGIPDTDSDGDGIPDCIDIDDEDNFGDEDGDNNRDC
jgi:hypothetical protein